jgi:integrase
VTDGNWNPHFPRAGLSTIREPTPACGHLRVCQALRRWYQDGEDLDAKLPLLATYLGHVSLSGTQHYLHLTAELFPEITARADAAFGDVIPRRVEA